MKKTRTLALALALAMLFCMLLPGASSPTVAVSDLERVAKDYDVSSDFLWEVSGRSEITVSQLKSYAKEYKLPAQYLQRFVDDSFVFKMGSDFQYIPVNPSLPRNDYNWNNLNSGSWEKTYTDDGLHTAVKVIDVSSHQGNINWASVKADGVDYAFIRLGYTGYKTGKMAVDAKFHENIQAAQAAGVKVGVYYYSQAINQWEAVQEANLVLENLRGYNLDLPVVYDIEGAPSSSARTSWVTPWEYTGIINSFMNTIEKNSSNDVMLYSYCKFIIEKLDMTQLTQYDLWLAQYYDVPFFPYEFEIWQYSPKGNVAGIKYAVDMNLMFIEKPVVVVEEVPAEGEAQPPVEEEPEDDGRPVMWK